MYQIKQYTWFHEVENKTMIKFREKELRKFPQIR